MKRVAPLLMIVTLASCGRSLNSEDPGASSVTAPRLDAVTAAKAIPGDCLQYRIETHPDGTETWNADYVYFYLVRDSDQAIVTGDDGKPLASGLLAQQALAWMGAHGELPGTAWTWRVMRATQEVRDGRVTKTSDFAVVDDADLAALLDKDTQSRLNTPAPTTSERATDDGDAAPTDDAARSGGGRR